MLHLRVARGQGQGRLKSDSGFLQIVVIFQIFGGAESHLFGKATFYIGPETAAPLDHGNDSGARLAGAGEFYSAVGRKVLHLLLVPRLRSQFGAVFDG
jgi:hypothetical protein